MVPNGLFSASCLSGLDPGPWDVNDMATGNAPLSGKLVEMQPGFEQYESTALQRVLQHCVVQDGSAPVGSIHAGATPAREQAAVECFT